MIRCRKLTKIYDRTSRRVVALDEVDLDVASGERVALVGRSGSGKSSLLNLLAGLDRPNSGTIEVNGRSLERCSASELAIYRRREIGIVFQAFRLVGHRTAFENVELPLLLDGIDRSERRRRVGEALERVGLEGRSGHRPDELSGGEQQRVALARAIVHRPRLLLADEPTGNLDPSTAERVLDLFDGVAREGNTTLFVITHDPKVAERSSDRLLRLHEGRLASEPDRSSRIRSAEER
ncbi:MAG TPA: macrolide ABC transporter ATP-binding protein [Planctomycetaceae bacterium]|nr:macrolide ABC transporter ATP-binding protein [Planctomycetaceae bacterium]HRE99337.1 ABC transporter ATP-binding protein [Pirellulaceae bacterium]